MRLDIQVCHPFSFFVASLTISLSLSLSVQRDHIHTVHDALSGLSQAQSVQLTQSTRPGVIIEGQQQSLIEVLPPILVLQLKRFGYDTMGVAKVGKQVRFGPELEIGHGMFVNSLSRFF